MTTPRTAVVEEIHTLVHEQIQTLKQEGKIPEARLREYTTRAQRLQALYKQLDAIAWEEWFKQRAA